MSKHTQGEWWASGLEVGSGPTMQVKVARVSGANYAEALANARLIAAAPKLLDTLLRCEIWIGTHPEGKAMQAVCREVILQATEPQETT